TAHRKYLAVRRERQGQDAPEPKLRVLQGVPPEGLVWLSRAGSPELDESLPAFLFIFFNQGGGQDLAVRGKGHRTTAIVERWATPANALHQAKPLPLAQAKVVPPGKITQAVRTAIWVFQQGQSPSGVTVVEIGHQRQLQGVQVATGVFQLCPGLLPLR